MALSYIHTLSKAGRTYIPTIPAFKPTPSCDLIDFYRTIPGKKSLLYSIVVWFGPLDRPGCNQSHVKVS